MGNKMKKDIDRVKNFVKFINESRGFGIKFTPELMDALAWSERVNGFGTDFQNYVMNYFVKIKKYDEVEALIHTREMYKAYFKNGDDSNIINLWQDYINDQDTRDCILSLMNGEFDGGEFDMVYFDKGKPIKSYKRL